MRSKRSGHKAGFTLIELLFVMAIIGLLATIILVAGEKAREAGRNSQRTAAVLQFKSAIELSYDANNAYIQTQDAGWACLGYYSSGKCWSNSVNPDSRLNSALDPFMQGREIYPSTNLNWEGIRYIQTSLTTYYIEWFLEGKNQSCPGGTVIDGDYSGTGNTYCHYIGGS